MREATARAADWTWELVRRIHLGTRKPDNWVQLFKFGVVGASGYAINIAVFALLTQALGVHYIASAIGAFCVAVTNNFWWNRHWTFAARDGHPGHQAMRYFTVSIFAFLLQAALLELLVTVAAAPKIASQAVSVAIAVPVNFIGNKVWSFGSGVRRAP